MTITVSTPDGGTAEFPDGTSTDVISSAMKAKFGGPDDSKPLFSLTGTDKVGEFVGKMSDAATAGFGAKALDALGLGQGPDGQTVAKQVQAAGRDIGPGWSAAADIAGAAVPGVGLGGRLAKGAEALGVGSGLAKVVGGAGEAAGLTAAGDVGHDETPGWDVVGAGALGGVLGPLAGKAAGPAPVGKSIAELQAAKDAAVQAADQTKIGNIPAYKAFDAGVSSLTPGEQSGLSRAMKGQLDTTQDLIENNPSLTGRDIWSMRKNLLKDSVVQTDEDRVAAKKVGDALYSLAPKEIGDASLAHAQWSDAKWLDSALSGKMSVSDAIARAQSGIEPNSGMIYSTAGKDAMTDLANAGPGPVNQWLQTKAAQGINTGIKGAAYGYGGHILGGLVGDPGLATILGVEHGITKNAGGFGGAVVNQIAKRLPIASKASIKRSLQAARASVGGQPATAAMYQQPDWLARAAQAGLMGGAASGNV
jgi:hypothetical protein